MGPYGGKELANAFRVVRNNTIQIARDIPEDKYAFVAAPGCRSVGVLLSHIVSAPTFYDDLHGAHPLSTLKGYDFGAFTARAEAEEQKPRSKTEILALLESQGEQFATRLESLSPEFLAQTFTDPTGQNPRTRLESLMGVKEHEMHHRGQLMLIERMVGVVPHLTRQREERARQRRAQAAQAAATASR